MIISLIRRRLFKKMYYEFTLWINYNLLSYFHAVYFYIIIKWVFPGMWCEMESSINRTQSVERPRWGRNRLIRLNICLPAVSSDPGSAFRGEKSSFSSRCPMSRRRLSAALASCAHSSASTRPGSRTSRTPGRGSRWRAPGSKMWWSWCCQKG